MADLYGVSCNLFRNGLDHKLPVHLTWDGHWKAQYLFRKRKGQL